MVPSSPYGPCSTGKTTSISPSDCTEPCSSTKRSSRSPKSGQITLRPSNSTTGSSPLVRAHRLESSATGTICPVLVTPIGTKSKRLRSIAPITPAAVAHEIECSEDLPPNNNSTRSFDIIRPAARLIRGLGVAQFHGDASCPASPNKPVQRSAS